MYLCPTAASCAYVFAIAARRVAKHRGIATTGSSVDSWSFCMLYAAVHFASHYPHVILTGVNKSVLCKTWLDRIKELN